MASSERHLKKKGYNIINDSVVFENQKSSSIQAKTAEGVSFDKRRVKNIVRLSLLGICM